MALDTVSGFLHKFGIDMNDM